MSQENHQRSAIFVKNSYFTSDLTIIIIIIIIIIVRPRSRQWIPPSAARTHGLSWQFPDNSALDLYPYSLCLGMLAFLIFEP